MDANERHNRRAAAALRLKRAVIEMNAAHSEAQKAGLKVEVLTGAGSSRDQREVRGGEFPLSVALRAEDDY